MLLINCQKAEKKHL